MTRNEFTEDQLKWLDALESGKWGQAQEYLRVGQAYCCLGVATKIVAPNSRAIMLNAYGVSLGCSDYGEQGAPIVTRERMRLRGDGDDLADMNDSGATFPKIAAEIRKRPWLYLSNFDHPEEKK